MGRPRGYFFHKLFVSSEGALLSPLAFINPCLMWSQSRAHAPTQRINHHQCSTHNGERTFRHIDSGPLTLSFLRNRIAINRPIPVFIFIYLFFCVCKCSQILRDKKIRKIVSATRKHKHCHSRINMNSRAQYGHAFRTRDRLSNTGKCSVGIKYRVS